MSVYINAWRFAAAMVIFLGHASGKLLTGGLFWQLGLYLQSSVIVFFVLSGFVIAYSVNISKGGLKDYSISRISRLESVILPALVLTAICDYIGISANRTFYFDGPWEYQQTGQIFNYFLSAILLQNIWELALNPGINAPFWSLTFEAFYYALFGCLVFLQGGKRIAWIIGILILGGPTILALLPIWWLGVLVFKLHNKVDTISSKRVNLAFCTIALLSLVAFIVISPKIRALQFSPIPHIGRPNLLADYFDGIMFSIHLLTVCALLKHAGPALIRWRTPIVYLASLTFALYLFHRPLIQLFAALSPYPAHHWATRVLVIGATFLLVCSLGGWVESRRSELRKWMLRKF